MGKFNVSYEIVTEESAECGDVAERGFVIEGCGLRDAIEGVQGTRTCRVGGVEAIEPSDSGNSFRSIRVINGREFETGAQESRSLHLPDTLSNATRGRIFRLLNG